ncbi:MAG TPA: elongation factor P [Candidatus Paceibacterota bacterium]|nr:elongation factor P [Candidatus Paceibacterota bacterium]
MAKLQYNEVTAKRTIIMDGDPYLVLSASLSKKDRQKASNSTKLKNLRTGATIDRTFHQADVFDEAELEKRTVKYLYHNRGEYWFCDPDNPRDRFQLADDVVGDLADFVSENSVIEAKVFNDEILTIVVPIKVELVVKEASEAVKGNTSSGATKEVTLKTGYRLQVPQFINQGDTISVNTETGEYSERVAKA